MVPRDFPHLTLTRGTALFVSLASSVLVERAKSRVDRLDERQDDGDADSRSAAVRDILDGCAEPRTECEALPTDCADLRTRLESREQRIDEADEPAPPWPVRWYRYFRRSRAKG